jgi:hypothetical protein
MDKRIYVLKDTESGQIITTEFSLIKVREVNYTSEVIEGGISELPIHATFAAPTKVVNSIGSDISITGTADDSGTGANYLGNSFARWVRRRYKSATTAGSSVIFSTNAYKVIYNKINFKFRVIMRVGNEDSVAVSGRTFFGFYVNNSIPNQEPSTVSRIFGLANDSTDTNMQIMHNDTSGTAVKIDLGINFPANTVSVDNYIFEFWKNEGSLEIFYKVTNVHNSAVAEGSVTTELPPEDFYTAIMQRSNATNASEVRLSFSKFIVYY